MIDKQERSALTAALCNVVREYVAKTEERLSKWASGELRALSDLVEEKFRQLPEPKQGERGEKGDKGDKGDIGERGDPGPEGVRGERGEKGETGEQGIAGPRGEIGEKGERGDRGERGESGPIGEKGERGEPGESIRGEKGETGDSGERGERGEKGEIGSIGPIGERGLNGSDGKDGRDGRDGKDGINGRDALELDIIEAEEGKVYPRGTFATHKGGLVRFVNSNIVQVITRGIDTLDIIQAEDFRSFTVKVALTDGHLIEKRFAMPVVIDRGVYRAGNSYERGDAVSHQGSIWICNSETTVISPATPNNKDWRLSVKAGRDGKDPKPPISFDPVVRLK